MREALKQGGVLVDVLDEDSESFGCPASRSLDDGG